MLIWRQIVIRDLKPVLYHAMVCNGAHPDTITICMICCTAELLSTLEQQEHDQNLDEMSKTFQKKQHKKIIM